MPEVTAQIVYLDIEVNGFKTLGLVNTGADKSLIPYSMIENTKLENLDVQLYAANGNNIKILGKCQIGVKIRPLWIETTFILTKHITEPMLSIELLHENNARWDFYLGLDWDFQCR